MVNGLKKSQIWVDGNFELEVTLNKRFTSHDQTFKDGEKFPTLHQGDGPNSLVHYV
jgi:hypothetical protein